MREIKFRFRIQPKIGSEKIVVKCYTIEELAEGCLSHDFPLNFTILSRDQFTGLKDKNDKEIYDGDIVEFGKEYMRGAKNDAKRKGAYGKQARFTVEIRPPRFWIREEMFGFEGELLFNPQFAEVIGNLYENPELLGEDHA